VTGDGVKEFFEAVEASRDEYEKYAVRSYMTTAHQPTPGNTFQSSNEPALREINRSKVSRMTL
jgi:hypothetical protein